MTSINLYRQMLAAQEEGRKLFTVLIDPDKVDRRGLEPFLHLAEEARVDYLLVGGSLLAHDSLDACLQLLRMHCRIPLILFPGSTYQINERADAILFLSLLSGRNPELLIGQQVLAAPYLRNSSLEVISTGYILIDGGVPTTVSYMSNTTPIPADKDDIAVCTALAGEMLGLKLLYLDAGSGAVRQVSSRMIAAVRQAVSVPLIAGGGIRTPERALAAVQAGADAIVVGNALEKDPGLMLEMAAAVRAESDRREPRTDEGGQGRKAESGSDR